ncbi:MULTISPECIES: hypothetical protein [unclassified Streptomyces]|nr:hypothetical protein [Streptomyces sp. NBC_01477]
MPRRRLSRREWLTLVGITVGSVVSAVAGTATSAALRMLRP